MATDTLPGLVCYHKHCYLSFQNLCMTVEGLVEMFEGDFADTFSMCRRGIARRFWSLIMSLNRHWRVIIDTNCTNEFLRISKGFFEFCCVMMIMDPSRSRILMGPIGPSFDPIGSYGY